MIMKNKKNFDEICKKIALKEGTSIKDVKKP